MVSCSKRLLARAVSLARPLCWAVQIDSCSLSGLLLGFAVDLGFRRSLWRHYYSDYSLGSTDWLYCQRLWGSNHRLRLAPTAALTTVFSGWLPRRSSRSWSAALERNMPTVPKYPAPKDQRTKIPPGWRGPSPCPCSAGSRILPTAMLIRKKTSATAPAAPRAVLNERQQ